MHSMTGFGRAEHATSTIAARIEASSVNRKQGEIVIQLPRAYAELEAGIRKAALQKLSRGRVNISIQLEQPDGATHAIRVNAARARALEAAFSELSNTIDRNVELTSSDFLRTPEVIEFDHAPADPDDAKQAIMPALDAALDQMIAMRANEGQHLLHDVENRISTLENITQQIVVQAPSVLERYRENLHRRLTEAQLDIDLSDDRILKEIGLFADRCDITEEITRLHSHFDKFREYLALDEPVGRPLDFLCQELNREFNTIGSKANDATLAQHIVNAKTELEKIREQIQNVE
ncbi:MAG: YicC family protein [Verrucomicrobiae bacterium]|nr:YicC family protein [Verrucomicrobiae bacterium]NNJ43121.1 YicC family protein [Akkermansiaceae bacterium]